MTFLPLLISLSSVPVPASDPVKADRLARAIAMIGSADQIVPRRPGEDTGDLSRRLAIMRSALEQAHDLMSPEVSDLSTEKGYGEAKAALARLDHDLETMSSLEACNRAIYVVQEKQRDASAGADEMAAMDRAVAKLGESARGEIWVAWAQWARREADGQHARRTELERATAAELVAKEERAARMALEERAAQAGKRVAEIWTRALEGEAIDAEQIEKVDSALAGLEREAAARLRADILQLRLAAEWNRGEEGAARGIAALLDAAIETRGRSKGKKLEVKLKARADRCYLLIGRFATLSTDDELSGFEWNAGKGRQLHSFHVETSTWGKPWGPLLEGFCATRAEKVVARAALGFAGKRNGVKWVVVSVPRDRLHQTIVANLSRTRGDWCDPVFWEEMWTKPVPGTIAFDGQEPVVVLEEGEVARLNDPSNATATPRGPLSGRAPRTIRFQPRDFEWGQGCPVNQKIWLVPRSSQSLEIAACYEAVAKKYGKKWDRIEDLRAAARRAGGIAPVVEDQASALMKHQDRDNARCAALDRAAKKQIQKVSERLADAFVEAPPATGRND